MYVNGTKPFKAIKVMLEIMEEKELTLRRKDQFVLTVVSLVILLTNATNFMHIPLGISQKMGLRLCLIKSQEVLVLMVILMLRMVMLLSLTLAWRLILVFHSQVLVVFLVVFRLPNKPLNLNVQSLRFNVNSFSIFWKLIMHQVQVFGTPNGFSAQTVSQVVSMMAPALPSSTATSTSSSSSNFSSNPF